MLTSSRDCRTIGEQLQGHALDVPDPDETRTVRTHLATCPDCRDEHHCPAAVPAHLSLLRKALAYDPGLQQAAYLPGSAGYRHGARSRGRRHGAARGALATSLTLPQWVSRLACVR